MGLESLIASMAMKVADTPDTPCNLSEVSAQPAPVLDCTSDTSDTRESINSNSVSVEPTPQDKAHLVGLVERVLRTNGWEENDIAKAVGNALADYHDALTCFTELAQLQGIKP